MNRDILSQQDKLAHVKCFMSVNFYSSYNGKDSIKPATRMHASFPGK